MMAIHPLSFLNLRGRTQQAALAVLLGLSTLLSACGSGSTFQPLVPTRFVSFGDGYSDLGQGGNRYTVNDSTTNIWVAQLATSYGKTITASVSGGLGFAQGNSRIDTGVNPISSQITAFLGANTIGASDVLVIDPGVAELAALAAANAVDADLSTAAAAAGRLLAAQVLRLTAAGAKHVVIANSPDLGKTPFATAAGRVTGFAAATRSFNDSLKVALASVTNNVLLVDNEAYVNTVYNNAASVLGSGAVTATGACAAAAIACTSATLAVGVTNYNLHVYADDRYLTPAVHRLTGTNAYNKVKDRW
jgi:outer membrane lipase/esterase